MSVYTDDGITDQPFFEILEFIPNPKFSIIEGKRIVIPFSLSKFKKWVEYSEIDEDKKEPTVREVEKIYQKLCGVKKNNEEKFIPVPKEEKTPIYRREAALFVAYFGLPKDSKENEKWLSLNNEARIALIMNRLGERTTATSFTRIM